MGLLCSKGYRKAKTSLVDQRFIGDDLLMEVLSRVQTKSLIRFRCVSKHWFSLLTRPFFVDFFNPQSPPSLEPRFVLLLIPTYFKDLRFYVFDWKKKCYQVHHPCMPPCLEMREYYGVTNMVNGLVCIFNVDSWHEEGCVISSIYNLTTFENLQLPRGNKRGWHRARCYLGFDPTNKQYKVLDVVSRVYNSQWEVECQVLTVGHRDHTWRTINISTIHNVLLKLNFFHNANRGLYHDGVLYWVSIMLPDDLYTTYCSKPHVIVAFNVEHETFELICCPQEFMRRGENVSLCQVGGYLSLVEIPMRKSFNSTIILWKLMDRENKNGPLWTKKVISCPFFNNFVWGRVMCSDFGLLSLEIGSISSNGGAIIDCYHLETNRRMMLYVKIVDNLSLDGHAFWPSLMVENNISLKDV